MLRKLRFNIIYLLLIPAIYFILQVNWDQQQNTVTFYGFAENKETELNYNKSVEVKKVHITPGKFVTIGDTLLTLLTHSEIEVKINDVAHQIESIELKDQIKVSAIKESIKRLEVTRTTKKSDILSDIKTLESEIKLNQSVLSELKSIDVQGMDMTNSPNAMKLKALKTELVMVDKPIDAEIAKLRLELSQVSIPSRVEIDKLTKESNIRKREEQEVYVLAPSDGLVGNIHCKLGENITSFKSLISFYERNPTLVKGYVHENLILQVEVGDTLDVISSYHPDNKVIGTVAGLGSRIVEIPERLRKLPEIKTYGREVSIQLPPINSFLQKEKVVLNLLDVNPELMNDQTQVNTGRKDEITIPIN